MHRAYLGEIGGAALAGALRTDDTEPLQHEALTLLETLEMATARILAPLLAQPATPAEIAKASDEGRNRANEFDWTGLTAYMAHGLESHIETYRQLREVCPATNRKALDLLVAHEVALKNFGIFYLTQSTSAFAHLHRALTEAEHYLATPH